MRKQLLVGTAVLAFLLMGVAGYLVLAGDESANTVSPKPDETSDEIAPSKSEEELERIKRQVSALGSRVEQLRGGPVPAEDEDEREFDDLLSGEPEESEPTYEEVKKRDLAMGRQYEALLSSERRDHEWASDTESTVLNLFSGDKFAHSRVLKIDCRETMCRMTFQSDSEEAKEVAVSNMLAAEPMRHGGYLYPADDGDGQLTTIVYFARSGHPMPSVEVDTDG
jgi:hypothetical protein